ncbi:hypothetical protein BX600DRAFT_458409 [Xylariales sp. PMI_506]|nr:hypothetical protein BX600DRAFT_458409 [Xylariales sp. PMI_506]
MPVGTGQPLTLPVFLADFLQGIVDRTQISIKGIDFQLDVEVPVELHSTTSELVTFQLAIDGINVEGVTTQVERLEADDKPTFIHKDGKRHISLNQIRACLISEANVFSTLTRTSSMPSSVLTNSPVMSDKSSLSQEDAHMAQSTYGPLAESTDLSHSQYYPMMDSEDAFNIPYEMGGSGGDVVDDDDLRSTPSTPRALAPQTEFMGRLHQPAQSALASPPDPWSSYDREARSEPALEQLRQWAERSTDLERGADDIADQDVRSDGSAHSQSGDNLAQSQVFSHEDAESMYMSAFSHVAASRTDADVLDDFEAELEAPRGLRGSKPASPDPLMQPEISTGISQSDFMTDGYSHDAHIELANSTHLVESDKRSGRAEVLQAGVNDSDETADAAVPDGAATPRLPTRLVKKIVSLGSISIYVPSNHKHLPLDSADTAFGHDVSSSEVGLDRSVLPQVPGAFSVYEPATHSAPPVRDEPHVKPPAAPPQHNLLVKDDIIEVFLAPLDIQFDASISFLLVTVVARILSTFKEQGDKGMQKPESSDPGVPNIPNLKISAEKISIKFLEALTAVADLHGREANQIPANFSSEVLLTTTLQNLTINTSRKDSTMTTCVDLEKFKFGYANDDIVSFDRRIQMRASVRDAFPSAGADISLKVVQTPKSTRCEITTLPLRVKLDLQRLDETFGWFGGLSSFLNMSSSATSNASPISKSSTKQAKKPRGVRFDAPIRTDDKSAAPDNKINVRVGGFRLDLVGKDCSVALDTSAIKLVTRDEGIGIGITKIQLAGPFIRRSMADPPVNATLMNTRVEYLVTPRDNDLERLLELIVPSKHSFDDNDDEIMVDTLLRQRRKGAVMRFNCDDVEVKVGNTAQLQCLPALGEEIARLATITKYLPEDDRPGIMTLALIRRFDLAVDVDRRFGGLDASLKDLEVGHITLPSLVALALGSISVHRNSTEELVGSGIGNVNQGPVLTMRIIPDAMEPVIKTRMRHINVEYRVSTIIDLLNLADDATPQDFEAQLAASVANLGEHAHTAITGRQRSGSSVADETNAGKPTKVDISFRDCLIGLNPLGLQAKLNIVLTDAQVYVSLSKGDEVKASVRLNKASILLIDDITLLDSPSQYISRRRPSNGSSPQVIELCKKGYVDICYISAARAEILVAANEDDGSKYTDVELRDNLLVLETCADSTQTLIAVANALQPPTPPEKVAKYRTKVIPVENLLASISADAFGNAEGLYDFDDDFGLAQELGGQELDLDLEGLDYEDSSQSSPLDVHSQFYDDTLLDEHPAGPADSVISGGTTAQDTNDGVLLTNFNSQPSIVDDDGSDLVVQEDYFDSASATRGNDLKWNSAKNKFDSPKDTKTGRNPLTARVRDVHFIWNLFDGYDWQRTREVITQAVEKVEAKVSDRIRTAADPDTLGTDEETVIGDFLFNSIYIGIPANRDPLDLARNINEALNDNATETESIATTAMTATPSRIDSKRAMNKLKLNRSKRHKITFELKGINADLVNFSQGSGETQSSIDVRVQDLDIFDHVPTSTWKKFATYDEDAGERELGTSMVHLELLNVRPIAELSATEIVLKATILPLRLHVDQDALDFITRFFEFKDSSVPVHASPGDVPFIQRAEVDSVPVKLDFKPKRVDYAGLRSGHTTEFMNFLILDEARMVLRHTIVYGVSGFDRLGKLLNDIWMPEIKQNQLPGILAGVAPVRSLANVGSGIKDLIEIPIKEYKKDGKIVRSIGKGAMAFAKTTGTEIVKLGAKMAVGTQYVLQGAEGMLVKQSEGQASGWEDGEGDTEETKKISLYADQPTNVVHGLRSGYSSLTRDLALARDAIIAVPGEVMESQSAKGAAIAVLKQAPTIIFRPLIGSSKAVGKTLMGATNSLDPQNMRRMQQVSLSRHCPSAYTIFH